LTNDREQQAAGLVRSLLAKYKEIEFLLQVGEYKAGSDALADTAIARHEAILQFLQQTPEDGMNADESMVLLLKLVDLADTEKASDGQGKPEVA
jgi:type III secretion protein N (ATPase)